MPPEGYALRQELVALPLQYDSEGKLMLPPKSELRKLLGRSPDLADSLALAAWALDFESDEYDGPLICWPGPEDETIDIERLTKEDLQDWDPELREIMEMYDHRDDWDKPRGMSRGNHVPAVIEEIAPQLRQIAEG